MFLQLGHEGRAAGANGSWVGRGLLCLAESMARGIFDLLVIGVMDNNAARNQIRLGQIDKYGEERGDVANLLLPTRYDRIVEAMGGYGE